jgi:hypothetical protein
MDSKTLHNLIKYTQESVDFGSATEINQALEIKTLLGWKQLNLSSYQYGNISWFLSLVDEPFEVNDLRLKEAEPSCEGEIVEIKGKKYELREVK